MKKASYKCRNCGEILSQVSDCCPNCGAKEYRETIHFNETPYDGSKTGEAQWIYAWWYLI